MVTLGRTFLDRAFQLTALTLATGTFVSLGT